MAKHKVVFSIPNKEVVNSDVVFEIFGDDTKIGELRISKGGLDYYSRDKKYPKKLTWEQFNRLMEDDG